MTKSLLEKTQIVLVCEGLDTVSQVSINGHRVGESENMFVRYTYNIKKDWLKVCKSISTFYQVWKLLKPYLSLVVLITWYFQLGNNTNTITITFESPVKYAQSHYKKHIREHGYAVKPERLVSAFRGEDQVHFIRKTQSSFSWDWGTVRYRQFPFLYNLEIIIVLNEILFAI